MEGLTQNRTRDLSVTTFSVEEAITAERDEPTTPSGGLDDSNRPDGLEGPIWSTNFA